MNDHEYCDRCGVNLRRAEYRGEGEPWCADCVAILKRRVLKLRRKNRRLAAEVQLLREELAKPRGVFPPITAAPIRLPAEARDEG